MKDDQDRERYWRKDAACLGKHADFWFPPNDKIARFSYADIGRLVCRRCPVWSKCLEDGKEELWGNWGGLTPKERAVFVLSGGKYGDHGTYVRYRQGCRCSSCTNAEFADKTPININAIPCHGEPLPKPEDLIKRVVQFDLYS